MQFDVPEKFVCVQRQFAAGSLRKLAVFVTTAAGAGQLATGIMEAVRKAYFSLDDAGSLRSASFFKKSHPNLDPSAVDKFFLRNYATVTQFPVSKRPKTFPRMSADGFLQSVQSDLFFYTSQLDDKPKIGLILVDVFTSLLSVSIIESKAASVVARALVELFDEDFLPLQWFPASKTFPIRLLTDLGSEYTSATTREILETRNIVQYQNSTNTAKAAVAEVHILHLKAHYSVFCRGTQTSLTDNQLMKKIVDNYNITKTARLGWTSPRLIAERDPDALHRVRSVRKYDYLFWDDAQRSKFFREVVEEPNQYEVGSYVRVSSIKANRFQKSHIAGSKNWEIFRIAAIHRPFPSSGITTNMYTLNDMSGREIRGEDLIGIAFQIIIIAMLFFFTDCRKVLLVRAVSNHRCLQERSYSAVLFVQISRDRLP